MRVVSELEGDDALRFDGCGVPSELRDAANDADGAGAESVEVRCGDTRGGYWVCHCFWCLKGSFPAKIGDVGDVGEQSWDGN